MASFESLYRHDFVRIAACVPRTRVGDVAANLEETIRLAGRGNELHAALMVFPELGLSAYAIDDLLLQDALLAAVEQAIDRLAEVSRDLFSVLIVGAPIRRSGGLFNTAVVVHRGTILGVVPKTYLPNYREFYEKRHFTSGAGIRDRQITLAGRETAFGIDLLFHSVGSLGLTFHVEICEDFWAPIPPSTRAAMAGAEVLVNLSASNVTIGKAETRRLLCASQSMRAIAAYAYSAAGPGESTTGWRRQRAFRENPAWSVRMWTWAASGKSACASTPSATVPGKKRGRLLPSVASPCGSMRPVNRFRCSAQSNAFPLFRRIPRGCARTATRPTTSRFRASRLGSRQPASSAPS
jgi:predicted amidohydrolase